MRFIAHPAHVHDATIRVPGDKSVSHRAVMFGGIADGQTEVSGFLPGEDCLATLAAMQQMGVGVVRHSESQLTITGVGVDGLVTPGSALDMGNSGTAMRLMAGLLSGQSFDSELIGDESLTGRPMGRIINPLGEMGATIDSNDGKPPLRIRGGAKLQPIDYSLPVASAQVKSAVLLAGLYADGDTSVVEPAVTRDHTERMLGAMGVQVGADGGRISVRGGQRLTGCPIAVPGDLSSAAFVMLAGVLSDDADILIEAVGINPTRTGVIDILRAMGADIELLDTRQAGLEPVADIRVKGSQLRGCEVDPKLVSLAIDEFPVLFAAAAAAQGKTTFTGIGELRVKESDRIAAMASGLRAMGIEVDESPDGAVVHGGSFAGATVRSFGDHRIAMSFAVAGSQASKPVVIEDVAAVDTSFPGFAALMSRLGLRTEVRTDDS